jgi:microcystin-dependent protein
LTPSVTVAGTYTLNQQTIGEAGGNAAHANIMPSYCVNFIIALQGVYPQFQ